MRHELVGFVDPGQRFSAAEYAAGSASDRGKIWPGVGGRWWSAAPDSTCGRRWRRWRGSGGDPAVRRELEARAATEGAGGAPRELAAAGSGGGRRHRPAQRTAGDPGSRGGRRGTGAWSGREDLWEPDYDHPTLLVASRWSGRELYRRIDARAAPHRDGRGGRGGAALARAGGAGEPRQAAGGRRASGAPSAIREICRYLDGQQTLDETVAQIAAATRRYARRQSPGCAS